VEAKRYYAQIMMPYAKFVRKHLGTLSSYPMRLIAPSHGPLYDAPEQILSAYSDWASEQAKNEVLLLYTSMHGSTEKLIEHLTDALIQRGVPVRRFDALTADAGEVAMASVDAGTIVFAAPVVLGGPHPHIAYLALLLNALKPKAKFVGLVSSYGWGNTYVEPMKALLSGLGAEILPPVCVKGLPKDEHLKEIEGLADSIQTRHQQVAA